MLCLAGMLVVAASMQKIGQHEVVNAWHMTNYCTSSKSLPVQEGLGM